MDVNSRQDGRASLHVVCSRGHDADRPLRIFDVRLDADDVPGTSARLGAQQRGGQLGKAYRRPAGSTVANHRCPKCLLAVPVPDGVVRSILDRLANGPVPHLTVELDRLPQLLHR